MKVLKQLIFISAVVLAFAFSASAQKGERPPKKPPVIDPGPKNNPQPRPPKDGPKKPGTEFALVLTSRDNELG